VKKADFLKRGVMIMVTDLQKAGIWKRIAAWMLDLMLVAVFSVGAATVLASVFDYDGVSARLAATQDYYEQKYSVDFSITEEVYETVPQEQKDIYDKAYNELRNDPAFNRDYTLVINLTLLIVSLSVLAAVLLLEFLVPLLLKNGQTVGKKCFSIGLIRNDGVKLSNVQLFTRALLGKYTVDIMVPVFIIVLALTGVIGTLGLPLLCIFLIAQIACMGFNQHNCAIHDLMSGTIAVDISSQQIFGSTEELIAHTKRIHAERAKRQPY
jgi:uncharacterized RDD family membrane protein YckC